MHTQPVMGDKKSISALVSGGEANAGPPLGPALGPMGVKVEGKPAKEVYADINAGKYDDLLK